MIARCPELGGLHRRSAWWGCGRVLPVLLCCGLAGAAAAASFAVDPAAVANGDGSAEAPFASVVEAIASGRPAGGDTLCLAPGDHGALLLDRVAFDRPLMLTSARLDAPAEFSGIVLRNSQNIVLDGARVRPRPQDSGRRMLVEEHGSHNVLRNLDIRGAARNTPYRSWTAGDWQERTSDGILSRGTDVRIENNRLYGVHFGIAATGRGAVIENNSVLGFSGDGMRVLGGDSLLRGNYIADCFKVDDNHDDGLQSWSIGEDRRPGGGTVYRMTIEDNSFLEWTDLGTRDHPLRCALQGIGMFDGLFDSLVIRRNLVSVSAWHGIFLSGARNVRIEDNLVLNARGPDRRRPWIGVGDHKDGRPSLGVFSGGNIAPAYSYSRGSLRKGGARTDQVVAYPARDLVLDPGFAPGSPVRVVSDRGLVSGVRQVSRGAVLPAADGVGQSACAGISGR